MRILLVEDEPLAAQLLAKGLVGDGKRAIYEAAIALSLSSHLTTEILQ